MKRFIVVAVLSSFGCGLTPVEERLPEQGRTAGDALPVEPTPRPQPVEPARPGEPAPLPAEVRTVLRDVTTPIDLSLTPSTVFCSAIGYGLSFLKVSIPQLDELAHFDHRVEEAGLPCAAVGACDDVLGPDSVLQGRPGVERVAVRVVLLEVLRLDHETKQCTRQLKEDVFATVRGVALSHDEEDKPAPLAWDACVLLARPR
jgi:hypothetical protein